MFYIFFVFYDELRHPANVNKYNKIVSISQFKLFLIMINFETIPEITGSLYLLYF